MRGIHMQSLKEATKHWNPSIRNRGKNIFGFYLLGKFTSRVHPSSNRDFED